jgi:hypothetical protein
VLFLWILISVCYCLQAGICFACCFYEASCITIAEVSNSWRENPESGQLDCQWQELIPFLVTIHLPVQSTDRSRLSVYLFVPFRSATWVFWFRRKLNVIFITSGAEVKLSICSPSSLALRGSAFLRHHVRVSSVGFSRLVTSEFISLRVSRR